MSPATEGKTPKRKRSAAKEPPRKRPRSESSHDEEEDDAQAEILSLEAGILESRKNYNNITALIDIARAGDEDEVQENALLATVALCRVFIRLLAAGALLRKKGMPEKDVVVVHWLRDRLAECREVILALFNREEQAMTALTLSMRLLKSEGQNSLSDKEEYSFPKASLKDIVLALSQPEVDQVVRKEFIDKFVDEFEDVRLYTFKAVHDIIVEQAGDFKSPPFETLFDLLSSIEGVPESSKELEDFYIDPPKKKKGHELYSVSKYKKQAQEAWLVLMRMKMGKDQRKRLLDIMSRVIAPWFTQPELLMDFLTDCYDTGGSMSLLALSGVFYLIQERNLDYPAFYDKLYSLLDADILHSKYRSRFFRLLDTFLSSSHLPAALVASFIKRLARLSLNAPPSAIVTIIPWMYNLFKKHPTCTFMMHRVPRSAEEKKMLANEGMEDPFLPNEEDPMKTGAIDSCVWEIVQLQSHYHPNVATIAKIVSEQFTKQIYNMEDFLDHSYGSLLEAEMVKNVKKAPVVEFGIPKRVFLPQDAESGTEDSLLVKLWDFN
ncbi:Maturation and nuclear export of 40S ribosomal subunits interacting protein [Gnomoniopsis smithogilvyi]|uniref:Maturation and nuclear export of 40S ribosomal subunits interacting protein n=1 Tax=Gnomoniopsis smithogilvyi TaxID=1191159 RepID=A0A9W8Z4U6_9PEZI|nr:Maturation and nuclear export of 40S ribosomal subunits interacting protein [Gnomoniopsis smithogilvyi]